MKDNTAQESFDPEIFGIYIEFNKEHESPANALKVLSELIDTLGEIDKDLISGIGEKIKPITILEDLETGSIKAFLKNILETVDDDGLKEADWKKLIGKYLVKGKYAIIRFLDGKTEVSDIKELAPLQNELQEIAEEAQISHLPVYTPMSPEKILITATKITTTMRELREDNKASFLYEQEKVNFNTSFEMTPESMEDLLTSETLSSTSIMILKVKKPDLLGDSMWELRHQRKPMEVKITDEDWVNRFKKREIAIKPGDSLKAEVITTVLYDHDNEVLSERYEIPNVIDVIQPEPIAQIEMVST